MRKIAKLSRAEKVFASPLPTNPSTSTPAPVLARATGARKLTWLSRQAVEAPEAFPFARRYSEKKSFLRVGPSK